MKNSKKIRMIVSRGNPSSGVIIRAGAIVDLPDFWADRFIADGSAELSDSAEKQPVKKRPVKKRPVKKK